jgi:transposase-like protein
MAKKPSRAYPPKLRDKVLELARSGRSVAEISRQFDVSRQTIMNRIIPTRAAHPCTSPSRRNTSTSAPQVSETCNAFYKSVGAADLAKAVAQLAPAPSQRPAASAVSSGRVLKAMAQPGADLCTAFTTFSNSQRLFGGKRIPPPITTQS